MSIGDWFRRLFSSPGESAEEDAALHEEHGIPEEDPNFAATEPTVGGGIGPGIPGDPAAAEAADAEIESEEAPRDPAP